MNIELNFTRVNYRFNQFELQPGERRLLHNGCDIRLGARAFDLLIMLVSRAGTLLTKEEIFSHLWPEVVVEENNLHVHISQLRKILGRRMIATVSGKGYRFVQVVSPMEALALACAPIETNVASGLKILLVDDHSLIRDALRSLVNELVDESQLLEADGIVSAVELLHRHEDIDLIMLDLQLQDGCGVSFLKEVRRSYPQISVVIISAMHSRDNIASSLRQGIQGFIPKTTPRNVMMNALKLIFSGGVYIPAEMLAG
jgi:DNA-binding response OmpR family regulator